MKDEIVELQKFKRKEECWICPECDSENQMFSGNCIVCGSAKSVTARTISLYTETKDVPLPYNNVYIPPEKKSNAGVIVLAIILFVLMAVGAFFIVTNMNSTEISALTQNTELYDECIEVSFAEISDIADVAAFDDEFTALAYDVSEYDFSEYSGIQY